jgi:hypothetical protein
VEKESKKLDPIETYEHSETEVHNMDERESPQDHDHNFTRTAGTEAQCKCGWGLYLFPTDELKDGHIYRRSEMIV